MVETREMLIQLAMLQAYRFKMTSRGGVTGSGCGLKSVGVVDTRQSLIQPAILQAYRFKMAGRSFVSSAGCKGVGQRASGVVETRRSLPLSAML